MDQHGSRFIQQRLESAVPDEKQRIWDEILPDAYSLMTDVFGNYVVQKMFEVGTPKQRASLTGKMEKQVVHLSNHMYGCRVSWMTRRQSVGADGRLFRRRWTTWTARREVE